MVSRPIKFCSLIPVLALALPSLAHAQGSPSGTSSNLTLCNQTSVLPCANVHGSQRLLVTLPVRPPSRTRVSFDRIDDRPGHRELVWDPFEEGPLTRAITLTEGEWQITADADPFPFGTAGSQPVDYAWRLTRKDGKIDAHTGSLLVIPSTLTLHMEATITTEVVEEGERRVAKPVKEQHQIQIRAVGNPTLEQAAAALGTVGGGAAASGTLPRRSTAVGAATLSAELVEAAGAVMIDRVRSVGIERAREQIKVQACDKLTLNGDLLPEELSALLQPIWPHKTGANPPLLPRTCATIDTVQVDQLGSAGELLGRALLQDLTQAGVFLGEGALEQKLSSSQLSGLLPLMTALRSPIRALVETLQGGLGPAGLSDADAQRLLVALAEGIHQLAADSEVASAQREAAQLASVAFAVMAECQAQGGCDARGIAEMTRDPELYFDLSAWAEWNERRYEELLTTWGRAESFIQHGLEILSPPREATVDAQTLRAIGLLFDVIDLGLTLEGGATGDELLQARELARLLRGVAEGAVTGDVEAVTGPLLGWLGEAPAAMEGQQDPEAPLSSRSIAAVRRVVAFGLFAQDVAEAAKLEDEDTRKQAERAAVRALSAASTSRMDQTGRVIFSLGGTVGSGLEVQRVESSASWAPAPLRTTLGVGVDAMCADRLGVHAEVTPVDIGRYMSIETGEASTDFDLSAALRPSVSVGAWLLWPDLPLTITMTGWLDPDLDSGGDWSTATRGLGLSAGFYVPLFDLN